MFTVLLIGIVGLVVGFLFSSTIIAMITSYLGLNPVSLKPTDSFNVFLTLSILTGLVFALPIGIVQLNLFIRKGLKVNEKKVLDKVCFWILPLFVIGGVIGIIVSFLSMQFFQSFAMGMGLESYWGIESVISHVASLFLLFAGIFVIIPFTIFFLIKFFGVQKKNIGYMSILGFPVLALGSAYITPPDIFSQVALILPIYFLIGITLLLTKGGDSNGDRDK